MHVVYDGEVYTSKDDLELRVLKDLSNRTIKNYLECLGSKDNVGLENLFKSSYKMDERFSPNVSPQEMLALGIFSGKYINGFKDELPGYWLEYARIVQIDEKRKDDLNFYNIKASKPLSYWKEKGWIYDYDPCGWFQWYCRYYMGRRIEDYDAFQIKRQRSFISRHKAQVIKNCDPHDQTCRLRQKQSLLHWGYFMEYDTQYNMNKEVY